MESRRETALFDKYFMERLFLADGARRFGQRQRRARLAIYSNVTNRASSAGSRCPMHANRGKFMREPYKRIGWPTIVGLGLVVVAFMVLSLLVTATGTARFAAPWATMPEPATT